MSTKSTKSNTLHSTFPLAAEGNDAPEKLRWGWRILLTLLLLILLALFGLLAARSPVQAKPLPQSTGDPLVLAFYYSWFDEATWSYDQLGDLPAAPYVSRDRSVMGRHIEQAQTAGIDAFIVAWYGPSGKFNQTEPNLQTLLDEAAARNFKIGILFETDSPFFGGLGDATNALIHARDVHFAHPAYLRADGRPVIFFWRPHMYGVDSWQSVRDQIDPGRNSIWIAEGVDVAYLRVFDGHHLYSNTWNPPSDLGAVNQKFAGLVAGAAGQFGANKLWVATVMPGYDDVRIRPGVGFAKDREGGAYYERSWQAAIAGNPNWIVITSFNEWAEGTYIEPSAAYGDLFLQLTRRWSDSFKGRDTLPVVAAAEPAAASAVQPATDAGAATEAAPESSAITVPNLPPEFPPDMPTAIVTASLLNIRAGADLTAEIVGIEAVGAAFSITGKSADSAWWQIDYYGEPAWAFAEFIQTVGPADQLDSVAVMPPAETVLFSALEHRMSPLPTTNLMPHRPVFSLHP